MNAAAAVCFAAAGILAGVLWRGRMNGRIRTLQRLCALLREMENRTVLLHRTLPQTVQSLCDGGAFAELPFLSDCAARCENGDAFPHAWNVTSSAFLRRERLRGDGAQLLPQLGAALTGGNDAQIGRIFRYYLHALQADLLQSRQQIQTTGKTGAVLCAGCGILLAILVL